MALPRGGMLPENKVYSCDWGTKKTVCAATAGCTWGRGGVISSNHPLSPGNRVATFCSSAGVRLARPRAIQCATM